MKRTVLFSITAFLLITRFVSAEMIQWSISEGGNGHWYDVVSFPNGVTPEEIAVAIAGVGKEYAVIGENGIGWHEARIIADYRGGYLAAIESQQENDFIFSLINNPIYWEGGAGPWFGGGQDLVSPNYTEPDGAWVWIYDYQNINFQPMNYTNWWTGEPSNTGGNENVTHFCTEGTSLVPSPYWNDRASNIPCNSFIIEYIPEPTTLTILSPNGGEQLLSGTTIPIQWNTTGSISDILIEYSLDNGASWIAVTPPNSGNTGTYDWTIPYVMSKECLIRVSDASHSVVNDISDATFEISSLYLTTPNGREKMVVNSQYTIRWNSGEALSGDLINLQYSTNKGLGWTEIVTTENDGMYEWAVPEIESNQYLIQITDVNSPEIQDVSQQTFMVYQCHEQIASDLDGDCTVGLSDFAIMAEQWLYEGIILSRIYAFDDSPSWTTEGQWEFGQPLGLGGSSYGNPDPNSGYTGLNVYGINLSGDYNPAISDPYYLTTSVIDCTQYDNMKVSFMSWLNIDDSNYAKCSFEVSVDGTEWITLWSNTPEPVTDNGWNKMEFDISEYADDNSTLYLRWGYQIIDRAYPYSGWNIDDVELWGTL